LPFLSASEVNMKSTGVLYGEIKLGNFHGQIEKAADVMNLLTTNHAFDVFQEWRTCCCIIHCLLFR